MNSLRSALFYTMLLLLFVAACNNNNEYKKPTNIPNDEPITENTTIIDDTATVAIIDTTLNDGTIQADEADEKIIEAIKEEEYDITQQRQQKEDAVIFTNIKTNKKKNENKKQDKKKPKTTTPNSSTNTTTTTDNTSTTTNSSTTTTNSNTTNSATNTPKGEEIFTSKGGDIKIKKIPKQLNEEYFKKSMTDYNFQLDEPVKITATKGKTNIEIKGTVSGNDLPASGFIVRVFKNDTRSYERGRHLVRMPLPIMQSKSGGHRFNTSFDLKAMPGTYYYTIEYPGKREVLHYGKLEVK